MIHSLGLGTRYGRPLVLQWECLIEAYFLTFVVTNDDKDCAIIEDDWFIEDHVSLPNTGAATVGENVVAAVGKSVWLVKPKTMYGVKE